MKRVAIYISPEKAPAELLQAVQAQLTQMSAPFEEWFSQRGAAGQTGPS